MSIIPGDKKETIKDRLSSGYEYMPNTDCWIWKGKPTPQGFGSVYVGKSISGNDQRVLAHRAAYVIHFGDIPNNARVTQTCGNKLCINPSHLTAATSKSQRVPISKSFSIAVTIEAAYIAVCNLPGRRARAVEVAFYLGLPDDRETLESLETLLENPDHFKTLVANGKKYYQAI